MIVVYAQEPYAQYSGPFTPGRSQTLAPSLFLAGPTPRSPEVPSWRPEALRLLGELGFNGLVFVPEPRNGVWTTDYIRQTNWEWSGLSAATTIIFWVPRVMATMPALTTNVEFGLWVPSDKCVLGTPPGAEHVKYLHALAQRFNTPAFENTSLKHTLQEAIKLAMKLTGAKG